ncbi:hypothetical protein OR60_21625 [Xanthomonas vesicatoria]|uniref:Uncharacterized protein n=1 Tax=Xanthomonas vesicatoria TaxID=56460 RepID=A0AAJ0N470_9XANT|nr:hypothetical protein OR60_21625 [Xanthomonas vesicatoria]KHM94938.1 hypothetical protein OR61_10605 [Xanthomonas vesicatoria]
MMRTNGIGWRHTDWHDIYQSWASSNLLAEYYHGARLDHFPMHVLIRELAIKDFARRGMML